MRIQEQRQRRAERETGERHRLAGLEQDPGIAAFRRERAIGRGKHRAVAAESRRHDNDERDHEHVDHRVLDERDHGRRTQATCIRVYGEHDEGDDQRDLGALAQAAEAHRLEHHLHADQLQRDVGQGRKHAGQRHREREPAVGVAALREVGQGQPAVAMADVP